MLSKLLDESGRYYVLVSFILFKKITGGMFIVASRIKRGLTCICSSIGLLHSGVWIIVLYSVMLPCWHWPSYLACPEKSALTFRQINWNSEIELEKTAFFISEVSIGVLPSSRSKALRSSSWNTNQAFLTESECLTVIFLLGKALISFQDIFLSFWYFQYTFVVVFHGIKTNLTNWTLKIRAHCQRSTPF